MTYDEILRAYYEGGGQDPQPPVEGNMWQPTAPVMLPDGRQMQMSPFGTLAVIDPQTRQGVQYGTDGAEYAYAEDPRSRWVRFRDDGGLAALALPFGAAALSAALPGLLGTTAAGTAGTGAAATGAAEAAAGAGLSGLEAAGITAADLLPGGTNAALGATTGAATASGIPLGSVGSAAMQSIASGSTMNLADAARRLGLPATGEAMDFLRNNASWLLPAAGALAGVAGNGDMTTSSNSTQNMTGTSSSTGNTTGGAAGTTSTASQQSLAPWLQGYAQDYVGRAQQLAGAPSSNATMDAGRGLLAGYAQGGDPLVNAATRQQMNVIGGGMLGGNPYIDNVARGIGERMGDAYATGTRANVASRFNNDGNSVGAKSAYGQTQFMGDRAFGDSLGQTMSNLYYGNYANERAAQDAASRGSLGFGQFNVANANNLYNVGAQDWQRPFFQNQQYGAAINPAFGSQQTGTGTTAQNSWQNVLQNASTNTNTTGTQNATMSAPNNWMAGAGGALAGAGLYRTLFPRG